MLNADECNMTLHDEMIKAQQNDVSLSQYFKMARSHKSEFFVRESDKLLYRKTVLHGFSVFQLVLPVSKRLQVMKMAHDMEMGGGHFAYKKTLQRIATTFWWPETMKKEVMAYTKSRNECQLRQRVTVYDRVPIKAVVRPVAFGDTVSIDIIGPIEPASSGGKQYCVSGTKQQSGRKWFVYTLFQPKRHVMHC